MSKLRKTSFIVDNSFNNESNIKPNDSFYSLFGNPEDIKDFDNCTKTDSYKTFYDKFREIFAEGKEQGLSEGEVQIIISNFTQGKKITDIEYRRLDDLLLFVRHKGQSILSWLNPEMHAFLLRTNYYNRPKTETFKPSRLEKICRIINKLSKGSNRKSKLYKFAEILARLP